MGDFEVGTLVSVESTLGYHPSRIDDLTFRCVVGGTVSGRQFDWGGRLLKSNGGAQRFTQNGWKSFEERKGISELDCETYMSSRYESRS